MSNWLLPIHSNEGYNGSIARSPLSTRVTVRAQSEAIVSGGKEPRAVCRQTRTKRPGEEEVENLVPGVPAIPTVDRLRFVTWDHITAHSQ